MVSAVFLEGWDECYSRLEEAVGHALGVHCLVDCDARPDKVFKHFRLQDKYYLNVMQEAVIEATHTGKMPGDFILDDLAISDCPVEASNGILLAKVLIISRKDPADSIIRYRTEYVYGRILPA
jgi:hypothetical protein